MRDGLDALSAGGGLTRIAPRPPEPDVQCDLDLGERDLDIVPSSRPRAPPPPDDAGHDVLAVGIDVHLHGFARDGDGVGRPPLHEGQVQEEDVDGLGGAHLDHAVGVVLAEREGIIIRSQS